MSIFKVCVDLKMGKTCCVPMCNSGYMSCNEKVSIFRIPERKLEEWQRRIPRNDRQLTKQDFVCEKHFSQQFVIREIKNDLWTVGFNDNFYLCLIRSLIYLKHVKPIELNSFSN